MKFLFLILCGVMKWNWSVISRCSCSEPAAVLCVQAGFSPSAWRFMEVLRPCLSTGGLCCFVLLQLTLWMDPTPQLSVCPSGFYFAARLSVNCLCFLWLFSLSLTHCLISIFLSILHSAALSLSLVSLWLRLCLLTTSSLRPILCCGGLQKRSGQMMSDDFRALLISTGNSLVLLLAWSSFRVSAGPEISQCSLISHKLWSTQKKQLRMLCVFAFTWIRGTGYGS